MNDTKHESDASKDGCCASVKLCGDTFHSNYKDELFLMIKLAWPIMISRVLEQAIFLVTSMYAGHLGKEQLDAMALGITAVNVAGYSLVYGVNTACDTLFAQTHGSKNRHNLGMLLQKALLINFLLCIPSSAVFLNARYIFLLIGQDPHISRLAGIYATGSIVIMPAMCMMMVFSKYLCSQGVCKPTFYILIIMNVVHVLILHMFLRWFYLDMLGVVLAVNITHWFGAILHVLYIYISGIYIETWSGWSVSCLLHWGTFCNLATRGFIMICSTWWCFEVYVILAGILGSVELGAHAIASQITLIMEMPATGLGLAVCIRVGNLLGSGDHVTARTSVCVALSSICMLSSVMAVLLVLFGQYSPLAFTTDSDVINLLTDLLPVLGVFHIGDSIKCILGGVLRGIGHQQFGAVVNIVAVYVIALPLGSTLMFLTPIRLLGTWTAISIGEVIKNISFYIRLRTVDWVEESQKADARTRSPLENLSQSINSKCGGYQTMKHEDIEIIQEDGENLDNNIDGDAVRKSVIRRVLTLSGMLAILSISVIIRLVLDSEVNCSYYSTSTCPPNMTNSTTFS